MHKKLALRASSDEHFASDTKEKYNMKNPKSSIQLLTRSRTFQLAIKRIVLCYELAKYIIKNISKCNNKQTLEIFLYQKIYQSNFSSTLKLDVQIEKKLLFLMILIKLKLIHDANFGIKWKNKKINRNVFVIMDGQTDRQNVSI